ncbi:hypothetical protein GCM10029992_38400 [Glycomyces albus]
MKSTVETLSPTRVRLSVEVPFEELAPFINEAYKSVGQQIRVPGFRPGRPRVRSSTSASAATPSTPRPWTRPCSRS